MDTPAPAPLDPYYIFTLDVGPEAASLTLEEGISGAILDERRGVPLTTSLWAIRVMAQEMWSNFQTLEHESPLPRIVGEFHPSH
jgi:hypothetical protein